MRDGEQKCPHRGACIAEAIGGVLEFHGRSEELGVTDAGDAPFLGVLNHLQRMRVLEQRLGRNASPDQARATERLLLFDDRDLLPQLRRANRGDIPAGARADDDDIV